MIKIFSIEIIIPRTVHVTQKKHSIFIYGPLGRNQFSIKKMDIKGIGAIQVRRRRRCPGALSRELVVRSAPSHQLMGTRGWILRARGGWGTYKAQPLVGRKGRHPTRVGEASAARTCACKARLRLRGDLRGLTRTLLLLAYLLAGRGTGLRLCRVYLVALARMKKGACCLVLSCCSPAEPET